MSDTKEPRGDLRDPAFQNVVMVLVHAMESSPEWSMADAVAVATKALEDRKAHPMVTLQVEPELSPEELLKTREAMSSLGWEGVESRTAISKRPVERFDGMAQLAYEAAGYPKPSVEQLHQMAEVFEKQYPDFEAMALAVFEKRGAIPYGLQLQGVVATLKRHPLGTSASEHAAVEEGEISPEAAEMEAVTHELWLEVREGSEQ